MVMGVDGLAARMAWLPAENQKCSKTRSSVISWYNMQFRSLTSASQTEHAAEYAADALWKEKREV